MSYGTISTTVNGAQSWAEAGSGRYVLTTTAFGTPLEYLKFSGGRLGKDGLITANMSRALEKDITINGEVFRKRLLCSMNLVVPATGFTTGDADMSIKLLDEIATTSFIDRLLKGEQ